ncbi:KNL1 protein, partial [Grantiella picta]|nr:KNL1 protein [Grantiella picta]
SKTGGFVLSCRVFQRDLKNNSSETENTGMNTLLHAPIQALGQETERHDVDNATPRTDRQDTTLLFSEENEMDMTASHTAMIQRNLTAHQPDKTEKINFTSFLAKLHSSHAKAESSKELSLLSDPANHPDLSLEQKEEATTVKKIHLSEFLLGLKANKEGHNPAEIPDKENVCSVPSQGLGDVARPSREFGYSHEPLDTCNVTKVFRGQEGGMEMTKCEAADVKIPFPGISGSVSSEIVYRQDKTAVLSKCDDMEMSRNYRDIICKDSTTEKNNGKNSEMQEKLQPVKAVSKVLPTLGDSERHFSMGKTGSSREDLKTPPSALGLLQRGAKEPVKARRSEPPKETSHLPFFGEESSVFLHSENMDMTGSCVVMVPDYSINVLLSQNKAAPGCFVSFALASDMEITTTHTAQFRQPIPAVPADKTVVFAHDQEDMDITACHTVAVSKNICGFEAQQ